MTENRRPPVLLRGDCLTELKRIPDARIDAVVTDPPYGLASIDPSGVVEALTHWAAGDREFLPSGKGFMGKSWDAFVPPPAVWDECMRILKPGGHLLVFAGSRTFDLMALSIRMAGFEIRDSIAWLYGCHDDQTEALTARGWVRGLDLRDDDLIASWSPDGTIGLVKPSAIQRYPFVGRMVRFRNADVDQLVTPNHRVYRQTSDRRQVASARRAAWSDWRVDEAASINRWQVMRLPTAGRHDGLGIGGEDYAALLGWVFAEGGLDATGNGVRVYQSSVNQDRVEEIDALLDRLGGAKHYVYEREYRNRPYDAHTWYIAGELATRVRSDLPEPKAPSWGLLWAMTSAEKRAFWDAAMKGDGSRNGRTFWQKNRAALEWCQALLACIESRGKIADDERGVLHWQPSATVELQRRHLVDDGEDYTGDVWCVTVPSGAFVVRRNGRVSVSGNSGFPKSLDVSKAIDKSLGVEPVDLGQSPNWRESKRGREKNGQMEVRGENAGRLTAPATDAAREWEGWGTALKPAFEPIVVARKPLVGTVAANVLAHGTGALNIDATRIGDGSDSEGPRPEHESSAAKRYASQGATTFSATPGPRGGSPDGRWPANVVLDESQAAALDEQSGTLRAGVAVKRNGVVGGMYSPAAAPGTPDAGYADGGGGASRFFYVAKAPKRERPVVDGTAHPTVKPLALMRWLVRLVTPSGGVVVDPFAGSGTTLEAAHMEGFRSVGVEMTPDYWPLIEERIRRAVASVREASPDEEKDR